MQLLVLNDIFLIINNLNIKNKYIHFNNLSFDFSKEGFYLIQGKNGCGKTTILEKIVFGKYDCSFIEKSFDFYFEKERGKIFTYIPQRITENDLIVSEYIHKENNCITFDDTIELLKEFQLDENILKEKYCNLSSGEKKKVQIISSLLKDAKYIFIDEPTNYLDDASVHSLLETLNKLALNHIIILTNHDERLALTYNFIYNLDNNTQVNKIEKERKSIELSISCDIAKIKTNYFKISLKLVSNLPHLFTIILTLITLITINAFSYNYYKTNYNDEALTTANLILTHPGEYDEDYYKNYLSIEKIDFSSSKMDNYITFDDIPKISEMEVYWFFHN